MIVSLQCTPVLDSNPVVFALSVAAYDEDNDSLSIKWSGVAGKFPNGSDSERIQWQPPFSIYSNDYQLFVTVSDFESSVKDTIEILVEGAPVLTDYRDGKKYNLVRIGSQTWMTQNLNYASDYGSRCYQDDPALCDQYGQLYEWEVAKTVCPGGWHLPSMDEWLTLLEWASPKPGLNLKSTTGWYENGNGKDTLGFNILPAGRWYSSESFGHLGRHASFWTSDEKGTETAMYIRFDYYGDDGYQYESDKTSGFSVRCIQDR